MLCGLIGLGAGMVLIGLTPSSLFGMALAALALTGVMGSLVDGPIFAILQSAVAPEMQGRVITVAYYALIRINGQKDLRPITQYAKKAFWHPVNELPKLAFDHSEIFKVGFNKLRRRLNYQPIAFELLPEKFTLTQLQSLYEAVLNKKLDKRNFRKKMLSYGFLKELDEKQKGVSYRAAKLYKFDRRKYSKIFQNELNLEKAKVI
ncbi:MAG: NrtR DNA-binding winged helix domain-containing protein [Mucilaginibacter sp.]